MENVQRSLLKTYFTAEVFGFKDETQNIPTNDYHFTDTSEDPDRLFFESASEFDPTLRFSHNALKTLSETVLDTILPSLPNINRYDIERKALENILANLWVSVQRGYPVYYSRDRQVYTRPKRYGLEHYAYKRVVRLMDTLEKQDFIRSHKGFLKRGTLGRRTRAMPTALLADLFFNIKIMPEERVLRQEPLEEIIILKGTKTKRDYKPLMNYRDTARVIQWRRELSEYNSFMENTDVSFIVDEQCLNTDENQRLASAELKGIVERMPIPGAQCHEILKDTIDIAGDTISTLDNIGDIIRLRELNHALPTITQNISHNYLLLYSNRGKKLHRVFNNGKWTQGGRFYGAFHQSLSKELRSRILINSQPTVELDYSGMHIRMLYHLSGIDYRDDPYIALCQSPEERKLYKLVLLVCINAETEEKAIRAIRNEIHKNGFTCGKKDNDIRELIQRFKDIHPKIASFLTTGRGLYLQNLDSQIANKILQRGVQHNIPLLPVHDSFIVPVSHTGFLKQAMIEEYEKVMKFKPVIG